MGGRGRGRGRGEYQRPEGAGHAAGTEREPAREGEGEAKGDPTDHDKGVPKFRKREFDRRSSNGRYESLEYQVYYSLECPLQLHFPMAIYYEADS